MRGVGFYGGLPAIIDYANANEWWVHGERHRDGGQPASLNTRFVVNK